MMRATQAAPVWRSMLFVPANNERFLAKAAERGADALILDLEDSVPLAQKAAARERCVEAIHALRGADADLTVRINAPLRLAVPDLEAVILPGVRALLIPKCVGASQLNLLSQAVTELERERELAVGSIAFCPIIETPAAFLRMAQIAAAEPRCIALTLGAEDFATAVGMEPGADTLALPKQQLVFAARAAGLLPIGLLDTIANYSDVERAVEVARRSARFGFEGAACIHPGLVSILNQAFSPTADAIDWARKVVAAAADAEGLGHGAATVNGMMIDAPIVARARRILARAEVLHL